MWTVWQRAIPSILPLSVVTNEDLPMFYTSLRGVAEAALHHLSRPPEISKIPSPKNVQFTCVNNLPLKP